MKKITNKKKFVTILLVVVILVIAAGVIMWKKGILFVGSDDEKIYVESVATITGTPLGATNQFMGVVEAGQMEEFRNDGGKEIGEVFVSVGDVVTEGTPLFSYDNKEEMQEVERLQQELINYDSQIARYQSQIAELEAERNTVSESDKFEYTTEIQTIQLSIDEAVNSKQSAQEQIQEAKENIDKNIVTSTIDGVVKSISNGEENDYGESKAFMTIFSDESFRVKAMVNEQNIAALTEGQEMLLRSRVNDETWKGTITLVDTDNPVSGGNYDMEMEENGEMSTSTKYYVYINIENADGLMLGQHLYVEMDNGANGKEKGIWLNRGYVVEDGDTAYIWCVNKRDKLEKRKVTLGKYREETDEILVKKGLKATDYIAFPSEDLREGMSVAKEEEMQDDQMEPEGAEE